MAVLCMYFTRSNPGCGRTCLQANQKPLLRRLRASSRAAFLFIHSVLYPSLFLLLCTSSMYVGYLSVFVDDS